MTTPPNWPNPERPYYPNNSDVSGWHWVEDAGDMRPIYWCARSLTFFYHSGPWAKLVFLSLDSKYHGPCLPPAQIAERLKAEQERCASALDRLKNKESEMYGVGLMTCRAEITIRAYTSGAEEIRNLEAAP